MKSSSSWECKSRNLLILENEKDEVFLSERMKKSSSSWERSLPLHENEKQWPIEMRLLLLLCSSVLGTGNKLHPVDHLEKCLQMHFLQSRCVEIVFVSCDTLVTATRRSPQTREAPHRAWEDPPSPLFQPIFWDPWFFSPCVAASWGRPYFTSNIAKNMSISCPSDLCCRGGLVKSNQNKDSSGFTILVDFLPNLRFFKGWYP